jgi:hypothetical protein
VTVSSSPTAANASGPTAVNASNATACITDLSIVLNSQYTDNGTVAIPINTLGHQEFILCPNTEFKTGFFNAQGTGIVGGAFPLCLRSNMTIKCGVDGKSTNNCSITTGDAALVTQNGFFEINETVIENAVVSGITFAGSIRQQMFVLAQLGGSINVIDCRFLVRHGSVLQTLAA